ncbi:MAG: hypothetical protein ACI85O_002550, partial [Saprospiraceae bacterium]
MWFGFATRKRVVNPLNELAASLCYANHFSFATRCTPKSYIMKIKTTLLLLLCALYLQAQHDYVTFAPQTYIYEITTAEADSFYHQSQYTFESESWHFHTLRDSILHDSPKEFKEIGHFIFVSIEKENVLFNLRSFNSLTAHVLNSKRDLSIQVFDNEGLTVSNSEVFLDDTRIPFQQKSKSYFLKKQKNGGFLKITAKGETIFYKLSREKGRWALVQTWQRFTYTPIGRFVTKPYRMVKGFIKYMYSGVVRKNWRHVYWSRFIPFKKLVYRIKQNSEKRGGYIVLNKPKYQPGDTVKVKAYLTNHKGKPLRRPQTLSFKG